MVDRIRQLLQHKQLTPTQFADAIGIARPIVSHILSGRNKPSLEVVQKILAAFADLSMPWLLNGSGPMWTTAPIVASASVATAPAVAMPSAPPETPTTAPNAAETSLVNAVAPPVEDTRSSEARRQPNKRPASEPITSASAPQTPIPVTLPRPRRFQAAASGRANPATIEAPPEVPQSRPEVAAVPEPAVAPSPVSAPTPALAAQSSAPAPTVANDAAAAFLLQPGKAIRRIVIFYQDGSFADYQPE